MPKISTLSLSGKSARLPASLFVLLLGAAASHVASAADLQKRVLDLYTEATDAKASTSAPFRSAASALDHCAASHGTVSQDAREQICTGAQKRVDECRVYRTEWEKRRTAVLAEIDRQSPGLGQDYTERVVAKGDMVTPMMDPRTGKPLTEEVSSLRGVGPQPDHEQRWNDAVRGLRTLEMVACPGVVPGVVSGGEFLTPAEALALWAEEDRPKPMKRPTSGTTAAQFNSAVQQADAEGQVRDIEEAAAEMERQRLAKVKEEQDRIAAVAARKAAEAKAQALAQEQAEQEREERAAAKAQAKTAAATNSRSSSSGRSGKVSSASSVCRRNFDKIRGMEFPPLPADQWGQVQAYVDVSKMFAMLWQPCAGYDQEAKGEYEQRMNDYQQLQNACNGNGASCTQWGVANPQQTMAYYNWWKTEVDKTLSDPNYSADQGRLRSGPGSGSSAGLSGASSGKGDSVGAQCREGLARLDDEASVINRRRPANSEPVPSMQAELYILGKRMEFMDSSCRDQPEYRDYAVLRKTYDQLMSTCQQVASSPTYCVAKLPW